VVGGGGLPLGFIRGYFADRKLFKLKGQVSKTPRPDLFLALINLHRDRGEMDAAAAVAKRGASRYPDHPTLARTRDEIESQERANEIDRIRRRIESYPNQILYARLADLYRGSGMLEEAMQVCEAGIANFPNYGGAHLILGQICIEKGDAEGARKHIEKATELDSYNYMALKLLAQVYMQLERPADAAARLQEILYFAPGDEAVTQLLIEAKGAAGEPVGDLQAAAAAAPAAADAPKAPRGAIPGEGRATLLSRDRQARAKGKVLGDHIATFRQIEGVSGAILVDNYGLVIASDIAMEVEEELAGAMITNIFRTTSQSAEDMGIGSFSEGLIEGDSGHIHVIGVGEMVLAVFAAPETKAGMLHQAVMDFVTKVKAM